MLGTNFFGASSLKWTEEFLGVCPRCVMTPATDASGRCLKHDTRPYPFRPPHPHPPRPPPLLQNLLSRASLCKACNSRNKHPPVSAFFFSQNDTRCPLSSFVRSHPSAASLTRRSVLERRSVLTPVVSSPVVSPVVCHSRHAFPAPCQASLTSTVSRSKLRPTSSLTLLSPRLERCHERRRRRVTLTPKWRLSRSGGRPNVGRTRSATTQLSTLSS